jgi:hypothetical protein
VIQNSTAFTIRIWSLLTNASAHVQFICSQRFNSIHFLFTQEELDSIINYDLKYRIGKEEDSLDDGE